MKQALVIVGALAVFAGCSGSEPKKEPPACGSAEAFNLRACDRATLSSLERGGIWNTQLTSVTAQFPASFSLHDPAAPLLHGRPARLESSADSFFLFGEPVTFTTESGERSVFYTYAGCEAPDADTLRGRFMRCTNGQQTLAGDFEARRIRRIEGEAEANMLTLVSETPMPKQGEAADVFVANGHAFVSGFESGLWIVDVQDPAMPAVVSHIEPPEPDYWNAAWVVDTTVYIASARKGVLIYDVANPAAPVAVGSVPAVEDRLNVHTLFVDGTTLYAMSPAPNAETLIFDVSTPAMPALLSRFVAQGASAEEGRHPHDATVFGGRLYVNHWASGLVIADVQDPAKPAELGRFTYEDATSHASAVGIIGGRTIVFEGGEDWGAHLRVIDATDPANPTQIGEFALRPEVSLHNMQLVGTRLYVAWYQDGVRVLDVSSPAAPVQVGYYNTWRESDPGRGRSFYDGAIGIRTPGDGYIYVTDLSRGLMIFREP